jgi:hypothetical protein
MEEAIMSVGDFDGSVDLLLLLEVVALEAFFTLELPLLLFVFDDLLEKDKDLRRPFVAVLGTAREELIDLCKLPPAPPFEIRPLPFPNTALSESSSNTSKPSSPPYVPPRIESLETIRDLEDGPLYISSAPQTSSSGPPPRRPNDLPRAGGGGGGK